MPKQTEDQHIGHKLAEAIEAKGVTQADVARHFGVKPPSVNEWIKLGRIHKKHIPGLVEYFGLPYEWWFGAAGADKKINDVMLHMLQMTETEKNRLVREAFSNKKPEGNGGHAPKRATK